MNSTFISEGDDTITLDEDQGNLYDQGGADIYQYDYDSLGDPEGPINIYEDTNTSTADRVEISGVDPEDIYFAKMPNGDLRIYIDPPGAGGSRDDPALVIKEQFGEPGAPKMNTVWVYPPGGGAPSVIQLNDPDDFPPGFPAALEGWIDDPRDLYDDAPPLTSPLVVDLDGDGVELTTFNATTTETFFDVDGDGFAEQTAWVGADDGLLVRDLNGNGTIDDATELFGSATVDGFALLAELDSNGDLTIDTNDTAWDDLKIWKDANSDAVTQSSELLTLASQDIVSIDLIGVTASTTTISGNPISHTSTVKHADGSTDAIVDAWFVHDDMNTLYVEDYTHHTATDYLPNLRGFGELAAFNIAMSENDALRTAVWDFAATWDFSRFASNNDQDPDIKDIVYKWAGVDTVAANSRGVNVDAQHLEFLETFFAENFLQLGFLSNPRARAGAFVESAWDEVYGNLKAQLLIQVGAAELYDNAVSYNLAKGGLEGTFDLSQTAINDLVSHATATGVDTQAYWVKIAEFIEFTKGLTSVTAAEEGWLDTALTNSGLSDTWDDIVDVFSGSQAGIFVEGTSGDDTINGGNGDDDLVGVLGADTINGGLGDDLIRSAYSLGADTVGDTLNGGDGNDTLEGAKGDDTLDTGDGGDRAEGYHGDDTYIYTDGDDVYFDEQGTADKIVLPTGVDLADLTFNRLGDTGLLIEIDGFGSIQIENQLNTFQNTNSIETIGFDDLSTLNLLTIDAPVTYGTEADDTIFGLSGGVATTDDTIYGLGGADTIYGYAGTNILDGGAGNDKLYAGGTHDTIIASAGFDWIDATGTTTVLEIPDAYSTEDVTFYRLSTDPDHLFIQIAGLGQVQSYLQLWNFGGRGIDQVTFADGSPTISLSDVVITTHGTSGNDTITAHPGIEAHDDNILRGYEGDDTLTGKGGADTIYGGEGVDTIDGGNAADLIYGDAGNDTILGNHGDDTVYGGDGDDTLYGGITTFTGNYGNDTLYGGAGNDTLDGGEGNDTLNGAELDDLYIYSAGLDTIIEASGSDVLHITGGVTINDITVSDDSTDDAKIVVNAGTDEIQLQDFRASVNDEVETIKFDDGFEADLTSYSSWIKGTSGNDVIAGNTSANVLVGYAGNDNITADSGNDEAHGGTGDDTIDGGAGDDRLHGGEGTDTLTAGDGDDTLTGGGGDDTFVINKEASATDTVTDFLLGVDQIDLSAFDADFTTFADLVYSISQNGDDAQINLGGGQLLVLEGVTAANLTFDDFLGNAGAPTLMGTSGNDSLSATSGDDFVSALAGNDTLYGNSGNDHLLGGDGNDYLYGNGDNDNLYGGDGNDKLYGANGDDILVGGAGWDTLSATSGTNIFYDVLAVDAAVANPWSDTTSTENFTGGSGNDTFIIQAGHNSMNGKAGDDIYKVYFHEASENGAFYSITEQSGDERLVLASLDFNSTEWYFGYEADRPGNLQIFYTGTATDSRLTIWDQFAGYDVNDNPIWAIETLEFGDGTVLDFADYYVTEGTTATETINGTAGKDYIITNSGGDTVNAGAEADYVRGGDGADTLNGDAGDDFLFGFTGNDTMHGGDGIDRMNGEDGDDTLYGDAGNDIMRGSQGADTYHGGTGNDTIQETGGTATNGGNDVMYGDEGDDTLAGGNGNDTLYGDGDGSELYAGGDDTLDGGNGDDTLYGGGGDDTLKGYRGDDILYGGDGNDTLTGDHYSRPQWVHADTLYGGAGNDYLYGYFGDDLLYGGDGADTLWGGDHADTFFFEAATAFNNVDTIGDFSTTENDAIDISDILDATSYNHGVDPITDWVEITDAGSDSVVKIDRDGTGGTHSMEQIATLQGITGLTDEAALVTNGNLIAA